MDSEPPPPHRAALSGPPADVVLSVLQAVGGLRNGRALVALFGCSVVGVLIAGLLGATGRSLGAALAGALVMFAAAITGINAAGVLLMDQATGRPRHSLAEALSKGLVCVPKVIALALAMLLAAALVFAAAALIFIVCKLPFLGPLLFVAAFPAAVVAAGATFGLLWLGTALMLPAIWDGAGLGHALAQALAVLRRRLVEAILLTGAVVVLAMLVGVVLFGLLGAGLVPTLALASGVVGLEFAGFAAAGPGMAWGGGSYATAGTVGAALLWALAGSLVALVYLLGQNLVYLRVTAGIDSRATEAALQEGLTDAKRRAGELGQKAAETAERARQAARNAAAAAPAAMGAERPSDVRGHTASGAPAAGASDPGERPPPFARTVPPPLEADADIRPIAMSCPHCLSAVQADDVFCGSCGHKLR
jgi:hypothetical protein